MSKKLVAVESIQYGSKFYSTMEEGEDPTKLSDGTVAYRVLGIYDDTEEGAKAAQRACGHGISREQDIKIMYDYLCKMPIKKLGVTEERCKELATILVDGENRQYDKE
jgi:hypothetical protein